VGRVLSRAVVAVAVVACAPLAWVIASALESDPSAGADRWLPPPGLSRAGTVSVGLAAAVALVVGLVAAQALARGGDTRTRSLAAPLALLSGYIGATYAAATAPVIGANIGAGLMVLGLLVAVPAAMLMALRALRARPGDP
jgi:hypothetical protein